MSRLPRAFEEGVAAWVYLARHCGSACTRDFAGLRVRTTRNSAVHGHNLVCARGTGSPSYGIFVIT